jgi:hypothetical protein
MSPNEWTTKLDRHLILNPRAVQCALSLWNCCRLNKVTIVFPTPRFLSSSGQGRPDLAGKLEEYVTKCGGSVYQRFKAGFSRRGDLATFSHGDCWNNNYMFRFEKNVDGREIPVEVKIVDLQLSRYGAPTFVRGMPLLFLEIFGMREP